MDRSRSAASTSGSSNMFGGEYFGPGSGLPHWEQSSSSQVYSNNVPMSSNHDQDIAATMKNDQDTHSVHSDHYDSYTSGSGNSDEHIPFPITPPVSDKGPNNGQGRELALHDDDTQEPPRKKRVPVPEESKDQKYWARRKKNNQAAKRSRDTRKRRVEEEIRMAKEAMVENQKLKQEIDVLKAEINSLRRLLKDANMTLSLWIKARQASEPNSQLPPMLRGPNLSFVNFPVTTAM